MEGLEHRVRETMEQYHMLEPGDRVIAAVSGGADSVCLLALLCAWREPRGISIRALHVHHSGGRKLIGMRILSGHCVKGFMSPVIS